VFQKSTKTEVASTYLIEVSVPSQESERLVFVCEEYHERTCSCAEVTNVIISFAFSCVWRINYCFSATLVYISHLPILVLSTENLSGEDSWELILICSAHMFGSITRQDDCWFFFLSRLTSQ